MGEAFGPTIRALREDRGFTQEEVAALVTRWLADHNIDQSATGSAVGQWESGTRPHDAKVAALEDIFGQPRGSLAQLLGYLPPDAVPAVTIEQAISADKSLTNDQKRTLRHIVRTFRQDGTG